MTDTIVTESITAGEVEIGDHLLIDGQVWEVLHRSSRPQFHYTTEYPITLYLSGRTIVGDSGQTAYRVTGGPLWEQTIRTEDDGLSDN